MDNPSSNIAVSTPPRRWPLFLVGVLLFVLGPAITYAQIKLGHMPVAWHAPALAAAGVLFMAVSVWQRGGLWRSAGLVLFALLCAGEWYLVFVSAKTPPYDWAAQADRKVPEFTASYPDGSAFTNKDLEEDNQRTVLLFFRGHW
jgi:hypothetical protein